MFQRGGAAHQINFILPSTEGNGKSLANPCPCPGGAGCGFAPACGGPCKRCCLPLLKMDEKKTVLRGVPGERSGCQCSVIRLSEGGQTQGGCLPFGGGRGKQCKPRKGCSPLDGAQRRKNGGLLHLAIRRSASQSAQIHGRQAMYRSAPFSS